LPTVAAIKLPVDFAGGGHLAVIPMGAVATRGISGIERRPIAEILRSLSLRQDDACRIADRLPD
jgi:hypothetical protein